MQTTFTQSWSKAWIDSTEGICCPAHVLDNASQTASEVYFDVGVSWNFSSVFMLNWMSQGRVFEIIDIWYLISLDLKCSGYVLVERILFIWGTEVMIREKALKVLGDWYL